jgi:hypothetical protein
MFRYDTFQEGERVEAILGGQQVFRGRIMQAMSLAHPKFGMNWLVKGEGPWRDEEASFWATQLRRL